VGKTTIYHDSPSLAPRVSGVGAHRSPYVSRMLTSFASAVAFTTERTTGFTGGKKSLTVHF
jgi:hypothetical protein